MGIQEWLSSGRDFETGRQLYEQHGTSAVLKKMFTQGPTVFNREKLAKELAALNHFPDATKMVKPVPDINVLNKPVPEPEKTVGDPAKKVLEQIVPLLEERRHHHTRLEMVYTSAERRELAFRILAISDQLTPLWELYNYAKTHGKLPPAPQPETLPTDRETLKNKLLNLRSQRSKLKTKPHKLQKLLQIEARIEEVEKILNDGKE